MSQSYQSEAKVGFKPKFNKFGVIIEDTETPSVKTDKAGCGVLP